MHIIVSTAAVTQCSNYTFETEEFALVLRAPFVVKHRF